MFRRLLEIVDRNLLFDISVMILLTIALYILIRPKNSSDTLKNNAYPDTNKVILSIGIGRSVIDEQWLCRYYEIIKKFARELSHTGIHCYIAVRKPYLHAIEKFVNERCSNKAKSQLKLKSLAWKDVDEKWFNELINKKEKNLLRNIYRSNSVSSNN